VVSGAAACDVFSQQEGEWNDKKPRDHDVFSRAFTHCLVNAYRSLQLHRTKGDYGMNRTSRFAPHVAPLGASLCFAILCFALIGPGLTFAQNAQAPLSAPIPAAPAGGIVASNLPEIRGVHLGMTLAEVIAVLKPLYPGPGGPATPGVYQMNAQYIGLADKPWAQQAAPKF
jgi:hypothetical protein